MNYEKYIDKLANINVLGRLVQKPSLLEEVDKYKINQTDFIDRLHKICFVSINNLYANGLKEIDAVDIYNYVKQSLPKDEKYFIDKDGQDFIKKAIFISKEDKFDYYYSRMKKFSLLRAYMKCGVDVTDFYNPDLIDFEKRAKQENWLDNSSVEDIVNAIDRKIDKIRDDYKFEGARKSETLGNDIFDFLNKVDEEPSVGLPLPFGIYNTATAGARLKKLYVSSAPQGMGKTRAMIANMAYLSSGRYYSSEEKRWINLSWKESALFISTELEKEEVQSMTLAFLSDVNEAKILGREPISYEEKERVMEAAKIVSESKLYFEMIPDFSIEDIERVIKINIEENDVKYIAFDYIHSSLKLLAEISQATRGMKLREDNVLFMFSVKLKDLANKYGVFIQTGSQVNRSGNNTDEEFSSNMLRGSSAIADEINVEQ